MNENGTPSPTAARSSVHVLIIEDNRDLARLFCDLLEVMGCTADVAWSGQAGLDLASRVLPDIIFCDISMPGDKDGFDVARELRADKGMSSTWLIAITGYDNPEANEKALAAGFDRVFVKPAKFAQIQSLLNEFRAAKGQ